jgi:hypothetical protein
MIQYVTDAVTLMRSYMRHAVCKCSMINVLAVWLLLSCCHSGTILTNELLSDVAGNQDDPGCNRCGGTDAFIQCAMVGLYCGMFNVLAVWLLVSCCNSGVVLTYELWSDVGGNQSDPAGNRCGGTDAFIQCAMVGL